jgi:hypothetical protein
MDFTPLVSPAMTPLEANLNVPEYSVLGACFSPLNSPALVASDGREGQNPEKFAFNAPTKKLRKRKYLVHEPTPEGEDSDEGLTIAYPAGPPAHQRHYFSRTILQRNINGDASDEEGDADFQLIEEEGNQDVDFLELPSPTNNADGMSDGDMELDLEEELEQALKEMNQPGHRRQRSHSAPEAFKHYGFGNTIPTSASPLDQPLEEIHEGPKNREEKRRLEGALDGADVAALLANHRDDQGNGPKHHGRKVLGGAALGALGAEVIPRARSRHRESREEKSRSRSRPSSRHSRSKLKASRNLAAAGLATAPAAKYISNRRANNKEFHRSRSRTRSASESSYSSNKHFDVEGARSRSKSMTRYFRIKSRGRSGGKSRSMSQTRTEAEITVSGLAGAAVVRLYEDRKGKEALEGEGAEIRMERGRSRSRNRSRGAYSDTGADPELRIVTYGTEPMYIQHSYDNDDDDLEASAGLDAMRVAEEQDTPCDTEDQNRALPETYDLDRSFKRPVVAGGCIAMLGSEKPARQRRPRASRPRVKTGCNNCK